MNLYALDMDGNPVRLPSVSDPNGLELVRTAWMEASRRVAETTGTLDGVAIRVSTVFLVIDHNFCGETPVLWETMIFKDSDDKGDESYCERFHTLQEAIAGHKAALVHAFDGAPTQTTWGSLPTMSQGQIEYVYLPSRWQRLLEENDLV